MRVDTKAGSAGSCCRFASTAATSASFGRIRLVICRHVQSATATKLSSSACVASSQREVLLQLGFSVSGGIVAQNQLSRTGYGYSVNPATGNCFRALQRYGRCSSWLSASKTFRQQATVVPPKKEGELTEDYVQPLGGLTHRPQAPWLGFNLRTSGQIYRSPRLTRSLQSTARSLTHPYS